MTQGKVRIDKETGKSIWGGYEYLSQFFCVIVKEICGKNG